MLNGSVIIDTGRIKVTVKRKERETNGVTVYSFYIQEPDGWTLYTGTTEELFNHMAQKIRTHNSHVDAFGGKKY